MLFNSLPFLIFFPIVALLYYLIPHRFRYLWLLGASYFFYMCWNPKYALLLLSSTFVTYLGGFLIHRITKHRKLCVALCLVFNLSLLFVFKYLDFAFGSLESLLGLVGITTTLPRFDLLLPVGISFYVFQALSYIMDVYRGDISPEKNFLKYALFVSFFPQLVAGPIERSKNLLPQINEIHSFQADKVRDGLLKMLWGFFLKLVIADRIAIFVDTVYDNYTAYPGVFILLASILFAFQVYCDFHGYSCIAIGAARVMGFRLMENFNCPYFSRSVSEFWRRWHISLSSWFKDYLYIPLGGSRKGRLRKYLNILIVFGLSGLWHGAAWTYFLWGILNGVFQIVGDATNALRSRVMPYLGLKKESFSNKLFCTIFTFGLIDFAWIFFRAASLSQVKDLLSSILHVHNFWILWDESLYTAGLSERSFLVLLFSLLVLFLVDFCKYKKIPLLKKLAEQELWFRYLVYLTGIGVVLVFGIWGSAYNASAFLYFQF